MTEFQPKAETSTPAALFNKRLFQIPDYQRGYAWERQQWDEFIEDIELLPESGRHYTGTVVLHAGPQTARVEDRRGDVHEQFDVVDGQQRLTTIVLLLDAVRRELQSLQFGDLADGLRDSYVAVHDHNGQPIPKLKLNSDTHDYFFDHVLHDQPSLDGPRIRSHRNLTDAKQFFRDHLRQQHKALGTDYAGWLKGLRSKICNQLAFTVYHVERAADAGVIFEVMNNRGKPITEFEKVKNYLLYVASKLELQAEHALVDRVNSTWTHIFEHLMASRLGTVAHEDQLLRGHWIMAYSPDERNWKGSKSVKERFHLRDYRGRHEQLLADLTEYVNSLRDTATAYCDVANPDRPDAYRGLSSDPRLRDAVIHAGKKLPRLRVIAPFLPLLIALRLKHPQLGERYLEMLQLCEKYAFRVYRLLGRRSNAGRSTLFRRAHQLYDKRSTVDEAVNELRSLVQLYAPDDQFEQAFVLRDKNDWYNWVGLKYFLYEYEEELATRDNKRLEMDWAYLEKTDAKHSIEHILPQTPSDPYWQERFDPAALRKYTHDLGNLCLTRDNSSYGARSFPQKRGTAGASNRCYAMGDLVMERRLAAYEDWDESNLLHRRQAVIEWALRRWQVEKTAEPLSDDTVALSEDEPNADAPLDDEPAATTE